MDLQSVPAAEIGDSNAALTGRAVNGTEYSLYLSQRTIALRRHRGRAR